MRQLTFLAPRQLEWREVRDPELQTGTDAVVRPLAVAICDADRAVIRGKIPVSEPRAFGHEFVAEVVEVGDRVKDVSPGDRVVSSFKISCGSCAACARGLTAACTTVPPLAAFGFGNDRGEWGGALSDLLRVPFADHMLVPLPDGVAPHTVASAGDNLADAWRTVGPALKATPGAEVLVVAGGGGAPSISLYAAGIAVALGAARVDFADRDPERLAMAEALGANAIEVGSPPHRLGRYPITVDASGHPSGRWLATALRSTEPFGRCTSCGAYFQDAPLPLGDMYRDGITFEVGWVHAQPLIPNVLELVASGRMDPDQIHTIAAWDDAIDAICEVPVKLVLVRD